MERVEALARHLARCDGWMAPIGWGGEWERDENTLVTGHMQEQVRSPLTVYAVPKDQFPVWNTYVEMAKAAIEWLNANPV